MNDLSVGYVVLGYASSERVRVPEPFLVIFRKQERLQAYLLDSWREAVGCHDVLTAMYIEDILQVISNQAHGCLDDGDPIFDDMQTWDAGALRTVRVGVAQTSEPDEPGITMCDQNRFVMLLATMDSFFDAEERLR